MVLNEYNLSNLKEEELVLIIASTTGNGDSPTNGKNIEDFITRSIKKLTKKFILGREKNFF